MINRKLIQFLQHLNEEEYKILEEILYVEVATRQDEVIDFFFEDHDFELTEEAKRLVKKFAHELEDITKCVEE